MSSRYWFLLNSSGHLAPQAPSVGTRVLNLQGHSVRGSTECRWNRNFCIQILIWIWALRLDLGQDLHRFVHILAPNWPLTEFRTTPGFFQACFVLWYAFRKRGTFWNVRGVTAWMQKWFAIFGQSSNPAGTQEGIYTWIFEIFVNSSNCPGFLRHRHVIPLGVWITTMSKGGILVCFMSSAIFWNNFLDRVPARFFRSDFGLGSQVWIWTGSENPKYLGFVRIGTVFCDLCM